MSHQPLASKRPKFWVEDEVSAPTLAERHDGSLGRLKTAFRDGEVVTLLTSDSKSDARLVMSLFLDSLDGEADVARISEPCLDAIASMREIVDGLGFKPKDMSLGDLENILSMFLSFQKRNNRRTVICFDEAQDNGWWVLDNIRRIVEIELAQKSGLMVVLSGNRDLRELLDKPPLDAIGKVARTRIRLPRLSPAETREYVRQQVESTGEFDIGQVFDFQAISRVHELSKGVPDAVDTLCDKCLEMVSEDHADTITIEMVEIADKLLNGPSPQADAAISGEQIVARMKGELIVKRALDRGRILIGRDKLCDIRLPSLFVSRHQVLIVKSSYGIKILDLGSRNGSFVNGRPFRDYTLEDGDVVTFGDCTIEYIA